MSIVDFDESNKLKSLLLGYALLGRHRSTAILLSKWIQFWEISNVSGFLVDGALMTAECKTISDTWLSAVAVGRVEAETLNYPATDWKTRR